MQFIFYAILKEIFYDAFKISRISKTDETPHLKYIKICL